ncbi:MAG TPA: NADPH-dependent FMN reductase [Nannocystis sp.]|jgi:NAD(P)H-dependent FMN reductase
MSTPLHVLAISGSLRAASSNTALLRAAARLAPQHVTVTLYGGLAELPPFNPDHDEAPGPAVTALRAQLKAADGVLISTPEYAHGVPGSLKNLLDWVVGSGELVDKPVALLHASRSPWALASIRETLSVMSARLVEGSLTVELGSNRIDEAAVLAEPTLAAPIAAALAAFAAAIAAPRA